MTEGLHIEVALICGLVRGRLPDLSEEATLEANEFVPRGTLTTIWPGWDLVTMSSPETCGKR